MIVPQEKWPTQITLTYFNTPNGVPSYLPLQIIHKFVNVAVKNVCNLPMKGVLYACNESGYQARGARGSQRNTLERRRDNAAPRRRLSRLPQTV